MTEHRAIQHLIDMKKYDDEDKLVGIIAKACQDIYDGHYESAISKLDNSIEGVRYYFLGKERWDYKYYKEVK